MKIINSEAFRMAQESARYAVENGEEYDWAIAMLFLRRAYING